jgi:trans-aconitate 2-methyltransferase
MTDWNPEDYGRFADVRLQPALDLLARVGTLPAGTVVDLGCGSAVMASALKRRFPTHDLVGVDRSPAMLAKAEGKGFDHLQLADIATWQAREPALIFSNAALQWVGNHVELMPGLAGMLAEGGTLAVQMPFQHGAPSHRGWSQAERAAFGEARTGSSLNVLAPERYFDLLSPFGDVNVWMVEYTQHLAASDTGHPVRMFTQSTFGKPYLDPLAHEDKARLIATYEAAMAEAYPLRADGSVLFPFRRLFFTLRR